MTQNEYLTWRSVRIGQRKRFEALRDDIADSLQVSLVHMNRVSAVRAARTAVTAAQNGGRMATYKQAVEMGIPLQKEWMATLDSRTRDSHGELDGTIIDYDKPFSNIASKNSKKTLSETNSEFSKKRRSDYILCLTKIVKSNNVTLEQAKKILRSELKENYMTGTVSDIMEGVSGGEIVGTLSHMISDYKYWEAEGKLEREAFTDMFQSCFDAGYYESMSKYFPNAFKEFKKMLKKVI